MQQEVILSPAEVTENLAVTEACSVAILLCLFFSRLFNLLLPGEVSSPVLQSYS